MSWMIIKILSIPGLQDKIHTEATAAISIKLYDSQSSPRLAEISVDWSTLTNSPYIHSVYRETLRLMVASITVRHVVEDMEFEGYILKQGKTVMLPARALQINPETWTSPATEKAEPRSATEFWPERFLAENADSLSNQRLQSWRPYGGGKTLCVGRHFAVGELAVTIGVLVSLFEMELVETNPDKQPRLDLSKMNSGGMGPDRPVFIRFKKRNL
jgi:cytochrome P450